MPRIEDGDKRLSVQLEFHIDEAQDGREALAKAFSTHPDVVECAAIAVPHAKWGETPLLLVIARDDRSVTEDALKDWGNAQLGRYQRVSAVESHTLISMSFGRVTPKSARTPRGSLTARDRYGADLYQTGGKPSTPRRHATRRHHTAAKHARTGRAKRTATTNRRSARHTNEPAATVARLSVLNTLFSALRHLL